MSLAWRLKKYVTKCEKLGNYFTYCTRHHAITAPFLSLYSESINYYWQVSINSIKLELFLKKASGRKFFSSNSEKFCNKEGCYLVGGTFCSLLAARYIFLVPRYFLFIARYFLLIARYFLLVACYFWLVAFYFFASCSLLFRSLYVMKV